MNKVLEIDNLSISFDTSDGLINAVNKTSLSIEAGRCLALVGESGSGKSQTFLASMGLLADNAQVAGSIKLKGTELLFSSDKVMNRVRGNEIAMIFQDPMTSLTPHMKIGRQLTEVLQKHKGLSFRDAKQESIKMLTRVYIADPDRRFEMFPHELSGGLRQRVMIAMSLLCEPSVIIADEPTTALDVTIQAQILKLLIDLKKSMNIAIILITHDLGVVAGLADEVAVMYAGSIIEKGPVNKIFSNPFHPYTEGLLMCTPRLDYKQDKLKVIDGHPPDPQNLPSGCTFWPRCSFVRKKCKTDVPTFYENEESHSWMCHLTPEERNI